MRACYIYCSRSDLKSPTLKASSGRGRRAKKVIGESKIPGTSQYKNKQAELADLLLRSRTPTVRRVIGDLDLRRPLQVWSGRTRRVLFSPTNRCLQTQIYFRLDLTSTCADTRRENWTRSPELDVADVFFCLWAQFYRREWAQVDSKSNLKISGKIYLRSQNIGDLLRLVVLALPLWREQTLSRP